MGGEECYHEIGRSIFTLMSDEVSEREGEGGEGTRNVAMRYKVSWEGGRGDGGGVLSIRLADHFDSRLVGSFMSGFPSQVFHEVAYKARNRGDLMAGIDEFLDKVTVLPPGEWDPHIRLEPPSKVPSQANRKNAVDKVSVDLAAEPFKCKHCKTSLDHPSPVEWTKRYM